jgi:MFS family permease
LLGRGGVAIGAATFVITMTAFFRVPLLPDIGDDLQMSVAQLGALTTIFAVGRLLADLPAGRLADRVRASNMMANSALIVGLGSFLLAAAPGAGWAYAGAFFLGIGSALTNTTGMTYFSARAPAERRGASVSVFAAGLLVGQAIGPTFGGAVASIARWRAAEVTAGAIAAGTALALVAVGRVPSPPPTTPVVAGSASQPSPAVPLSSRLLLYMVPFSMFASLGALTHTLIPIIGSEDLDLSSGSIGLAIGAGGLARLVGSIVGGVLSDRLSRKVVLVPGLLVQAGAIALLAVGANLGVWLTSILLMGLSSVGIGVAATMLADLSRGTGVGRQLGPFRFVGDVGLMVAPFAAAWLFQQYGTAPPVLMMASLLALTGVAVAFYLPETRWLESERAAQA